MKSHRGWKKTDRSEFKTFVILHCIKKCLKPANKPTPLK